MECNSKIYIAGHTGLVGSALVRQLEQQGYNNIIVRTHNELDLTNQQLTETFFSQEKPDYVLMAAALVGGILANNTYRAEFIYQNLMIQTNIIHAAWKTKVKKLIFLGSNCSYPAQAPQPMKEEYLLTGTLEPTNEPYAVAKIAGIKMCENYNRQYGTKFISIMPTSLYGPNDNFDLNNSHVLPALIRKTHEAKINNAETLELWGSGSPKREFMYVDDLAKACIFLLKHSITDGLFNIGTGDDIAIRDLAELIKGIVGFKGELVFDLSKPDGMPRKLLDISKIKSLGWQAETSLEHGIEKTYRYFQKQIGR